MPCTRGTHCFPLISGSAQSSLLDGLVAAYRLEEATAAPRADSSGAGLTLSQNGGVTQETGLNGSKCAGFAAASNQHLTITDDAFRFGDTDFSVSLWMKFNDVSTYRSGASVWTTAGDNREWWSGLWDDTKFAALASSDGAAQTTLKADNYFADAGAAVTGTWYHIYLDYDSTEDILRIRIDDNPNEDTILHSGGIATGKTGPFNLGSYANGTLDHDGTIEDAYLWSRRLSPQEISALYNRGFSREHPFAA